MRKAASDGELPKVLVERYEDTAVLVGAGKDGFVTGVFGPITSPHHVVACGYQFIFGLWRHAGIEEESQDPASIVRGSMRSLAAILRA